MIRLINGLTGSDMWVHETRLEEYLAAGHKLPAAPPAEVPTEPAKKPPARKKTTAKK